MALLISGDSEAAGVDAVTVLELRGRAANTEKKRCGE